MNLFGHKQTDQSSEARVRFALASDLYLRGAVSLEDAAFLAGRPIALFERELADAFRSCGGGDLLNPDSRPSTVTLSVVIPVYNERRTFLNLLDAVRAVPIHKEIIIVDDCSRDGTRELLQEQVDGKVPGVRVYYQEVNQGKGAALRRGFAEARGDIVLVQDADLEYDPHEYPQLIEPILRGKADVVYGSRFQSGAHRVLYFWHRLGNGFLTTLSNMFTDLNLTDMETCYKVFRREVIQSIPLKQNRFGFEPEVTAKIARRGWKIYEVPISYSGRSYQEGKKIGWKDGVQAIWCILRYAFRD
jgi:glycosyltransferase involved in cell wall biosynthesis